MKIIKRVEPPVPAWAGMYTCSHCTSMIEVEVTDRQEIGFVTNQINKRLDMISLICPVCNHRQIMERPKETRP